jgi:two-component system sensor kinase FixL
VVTTAKADMDAFLANILFAASPQAAMAVDRSGSVVAANPAAEALFGDHLARDRRPIRSILPSLDLGLPTGAEAVEPGGARHVGRLSTQTPGGRRVDLDYQCFHFSVDGEPFDAVFLQDVTIPAEAERALQSLRTQISTNWRLNSLGELAALVAHEVNQPLAAVANYLHIAASRSMDRPDLHDPIREAAAQAQRATEIIRRFRSLTSRQAVELQPVEARDIITEILPLLTLVTQEADVQLKIEMPYSRPFPCDRIQIQQVLLNLVRNAAEAARGRSAALVTVRFEESDHGVLWSVSDNGCGVSEDVRPELFKPTASTKAEGMGMGLSICRSIVESHGGRICLERSSPAGATFTFRLPLDAAS